MRAALGLDGPAAPTAVTAAGPALRVASPGQAPWFRPEHIREPVWYTED